MPRRRPPGAGPGLRSTTALLAILLILPLITTAAQQQQSPDNANHRGSPREEAYNAITPPKSRKQQHQNASKRDDYTPLISQNKRAVATEVSSAPADAAVRAPLRNAAPSGGLTSTSARSLQDWEVEDFVLLATVDGRIHARDRYTGDEIWALDVGQPMLDTIYNLNRSDGDSSPQNQPFIWIVEPKEDGALYILTPGPHPVLKPLEMTVKQLAEELAPYSSADPPVVYTAEKKNVMLVVNAQTGEVIRSFSPSGSMILDAESCVPQQAPEFFGAKARECKGIFNVGRTEYLVSIQNQITGEHICTIKYSEWIPNNRDRDLQAQYDKTMDNQYIYSRFNGYAMALDYNRPRPEKRPVFEREFSSPVVRVFDVARPNDDEDPEAALVLLPQPRYEEDKDERLAHESSRYVWLNTTETGSWYAMSEANYPIVTDRAPKANCYNPDWENDDLLNIDGIHYLPDRSSLVGVHILDHTAVPRPRYDQIEGPKASNPPGNDQTGLPGQIDPEPPKIDGPTLIDSRFSGPWWAIIVAFILMGGCTTLYGQQTLSTGKSILSRYLKARSPEPLKVEASTKQSEPHPVVETVSPPPAAEDDVAQAPSEPPTDTRVDSSVETEPEKKVRFDIPADEDDLEPLSRTTTAEQSSPEAENAEVNGTFDSSIDPTASTPNGTDGLPNPSATPTKKKKTHRGKRGGVKKPRKMSNEDEVDRIVNAAKELDQSPTLHPDEVAINGDDVQDVSNIKKIGKLTIDFDRLLGNGSGGTFVFEGKWNERDVAVKRMLPQYFGLAEQEVKLLQESDLHPNVIRYFDDEKDENFLYIAVEICQASLFDLYRDGRPADELTENQQRLVNEINSDVPRALYQLALGLHHLHSLRIIHRDIKPQNILIAYPARNQKNGPRLVISDFGLCKTLPDNVSTLIGTTGNAGTVGWKAPELILQPKDIDRGSSTGHSRESSSSTDPVAQGVKRAVDIFSLGCVFFYVLTNGSHPFDDEEGWMQMRELNIKKDKANFEQLMGGDDSEEPRHLIAWMLENRPELRPTAQQVMNHPFFWSAEKRLNFLCDCSDHWERECRDPPTDHLNNLEWYSSIVIGEKKPDFLAKLHRNFVASLGKQRKYTGDRMLDLLRALRNKKNHYEDMDESVKAIVGTLPQGYLRFWTVRFPKLVMSCYECVKYCGLENEPRFKPYFEGNNA